MIAAMDDMIKRLRAATEDDVLRAFDGAYIDRPAADMLEFFQRMLDVMIGPPED